MDSTYIVNRLKSTIYKFPTAQVLRNRLDNLDETHRYEIVRNLKMEMHKQCNADIHEPLAELLYRMRMAS